MEATIDNGRVAAFHHIKLSVCNAVQAASWYVIHFGFKPYASLNTLQTVVHVLSLNKIILVIESTLDTDVLNMKRDDHVVDVAFEVENLDNVLDAAKRSGAVIIQDKHLLQDENGYVNMASIKTSHNLIHTLIEKSTNFNGLFLPGYGPPNRLFCQELSDTIPYVPLLYTDHAVTGVPICQSFDLGKWYQSVLKFQKFWSLDAAMVQTQSSGLKPTILSNESRENTGEIEQSQRVKFLIIEPTVGIDKSAKSQIQEFLDYNDGPGVQHIAFCTDNIIEAVKCLRFRGVDFIRIPQTYYQQLKCRLDAQPNLNIAEDLKQLEEQGILLDYDEDGYLLQIFTKPVQDKPTFFIEIIQRHNHEGFGAGNIKALFEAVELEQEKRGNLTTDEGVYSD